MLTGFAPGSAVWTVDEHGTIPRAFHERDRNIGITVATTLDASGCIASAPVAASSRHSLRRMHGVSWNRLARFHFSS